MRRRKEKAEFLPRDLWSLTPVVMPLLRRLKMFLLTEFSIKRALAELSDNDFHPHPFKHLSILVIIFPEKFDPN